MLCIAGRSVSSFPDAVGRRGGHLFHTALQAHMASPQRGSHESGNLWGRHCMAPGYFSLTLWTSSIAKMVKLLHYDA